MFRTEYAIFTTALLATSLASVGAMACSTEGAGTGIAAPVGHGASGIDAGLALESVRIVVRLGSRAETETTYRVSNPGGATKVTIAFPAWRADLGEARYSEAGEGLHRVTVDGKKASGRVVGLKGQRCDRPLDRSSEVGEPGPCPFLIDVSFGAGQRRTIVHQFAGVRVKRELEGASLLVPFDGQKAWLGRRAGSVSVQVEFEQPMSFCLAVNVQGAQYNASTRRLSWSCTDCAETGEFHVWWVPAEDKERHALGAKAAGADVKLPTDGDAGTMARAVRDVPDAFLLEIYRDILTSRRAIPPGEPFDEKGTCAYGSYPVDRPHWWLGSGDDWGIGLSAWSSDGRNALRAIDAELNRRGISHPAMPGGN